MSNANNNNNHSDLNEFIERLTHLYVRLCERPGCYRKLSPELHKQLTEIAADKEKCDFLAGELTRRLTLYGVLADAMIESSHDGTSLFIVEHRNFQYKYTWTVVMEGLNRNIRQTRDNLTQEESDICRIQSIVHGCVELLGTQDANYGRSIIWALFSMPDHVAWLTKDRIDMINQLLPDGNDRRPYMCVYIRHLKDAEKELVIASTNVAEDKKVSCTRMCIKLPITDAFLRVAQRDIADVSEAYPAFMYEPLSADLVIPEHIFDCVDTATAVAESERLIKILAEQHELKSQSEQEFAQEFSGISALLWMQCSQGYIDEAIFDRLRTKLADREQGIVLHTESTQIELIPEGATNDRIKHYKVVRSHDADDKPVICIVPTIPKSADPKQPTSDTHNKLLEEIATEYSQQINEFLQVEAKQMLTPNALWAQPLRADARLGALAQAAYSLQYVYPQLVKYMADDDPRAAMRSSAIASDVIPVKKLTEFIDALNRNGLQINAGVKIISGTYRTVACVQAGYAIRIVHLLACDSELLIQIPLIPASMLPSWGNDVCPVILQHMVPTEVAPGASNSGFAQFIKNQPRVHMP